MRKIIATTIIYDSFGVEKQRFISEEFLYENIERILEKTQFDNEGNVLSKFVLDYFPSGTLKSQIEYNEFNEIVEAISCQEDENSRIIQETFSYMDGTVETKHFSYINDNVKDIILKDDEGKILSIQSFKCDENGNAFEELINDFKSETLYKRDFGINNFPVKEECYLDGQLENIEFFEYDTNDYVIKRVLQDSKENILEKEETDRDKTGQIEKTQFWSQESNQKNVAIYSRVNNTTEIDTYINDEMYQHQCFKFNENGEVIFSKTIAPQHGVNEEVSTEYIKVD